MMTTIKRAGLKHQLKVVGKRHIIKNNFVNIPSLLITLLLFLSDNNHLSVFSKVSLLSKISHKLHSELIISPSCVMREYAKEIFSVSISALSMILAAIAIIIVVYNKRDLHLIVKSNTKTFEGFVFPYKWGALMWTILALLSFTEQFFKLDKLTIFLYFWIFLIFYCTMFTMYIVNEVVEHVFLSALNEEE